MNRKYSWIRQSKDERDLKIEHLSKIKKFSIVKLPLAASNHQWCSPVEDQKDIGSCTAHAWAGLLQYNEIKTGITGSAYFDLSRLFIYFNERDLEGTADQDSGAQLRDGAKALATYGVCPESEYPYITEIFAQKPGDQCYISAQKNIIHSYYSLDGNSPEETLTNLKTCIANGNCFVFGFQVYAYFESDEMAKSGILRMPLPNEECMGGHAVMGVAYDDNERVFIIRNSWGLNWGLGGQLDGYFKMPYDYILNPDLASDFWTCINDV